MVGAGRQRVAGTVVGVTVVASKPHYRAHIAPVWDALPDDVKGDATARRAIVASWYDLRRVRSKAVCMMEHGAGQSYVGFHHGSYAGGPGREKVSLFLYPHERVMAVNADRYPNADHRVVGCPRLDVLWERRRAGDGLRDGGTVAVSFHWRCNVSPEAGTAVDEWRSEVRRLVNSGVRVLGHGHPRIMAELQPWWESLGVEVVFDWGEVVQRADVFVCDNSSTLFEAAAVGLPVVLLNSARWRTDVEHGLRFWSCANAGPNLWPGDRLEEGVEDALGWDVDVVDRVYRHRPDGTRAATRVAVEAVTLWAR